jgi:hypothetical protein
VAQQAGKIAPEGSRRVLDEEEWQEFLEYKNHMYADAKHKLIRCYEVTDAAVHDSQKLNELLNQATRWRTCSAAAPIARARSRSDCAPAASRALFMCISQNLI